MPAALVSPCPSCGWFPDTEAFWGTRVDAQRRTEAVDKYNQVVKLPTIPEAERRSSLREVATRWPGALREAELVSPADMEARRLAAAELSVGMPRRGAGGPREAVLLWQELHRLLWDQRVLRGKGGGERAKVTVDTLVAFDRRQAEREQRAPRWPAPAHLRALTGAKVRPRQAYLWLAAQAGLTLAGLHARLFLRVGKWDSRPDDPLWSRDASVSG